MSAALSPAAAQTFEVGIGIGVANTTQNAVAGVATVTWNLSGPVSLRGFADAELAVPDFKEGLDYREPDRWWIENTATSEAQRPKDNELWENAGWDAHAALYATARVIWRIHGGAGFAYNGLDGTSDLAYVLVGYLTPRTELDVEFLPGGRWRGRLSVGFWHF